MNIAHADGAEICRLPQLYDNRIIPIIITDITGKCNVRIQNPYTCTTWYLINFPLHSGKASFLVSIEHAYDRTKSVAIDYHPGLISLILHTKTASCFVFISDLAGKVRIGPCLQSGKEQK